MKINSKILSLPPYISTSWKNIASLHVEETPSGHSLMIELQNSTLIEVPNLDSSIIEAIFAAHAKSLDQDPPAPQTRPTPSKVSLGQPMNNGGNNEELLGFSFPLQIGSGGIENLGSAISHNPEQADAANLPQEILDKIAAISKAVGIDSSMLPKAEPHCNCIHCQIARAVHGEAPKEVEEVSEEEVTPEDLKFRIWDIAQTGQNLYVVSNPLDAKEQYNVFLGAPVGCTCGEKNCEHIRAVLNS